jgi:uncharacterized protein (DUF736 family)
MAYEQKPNTGSLFKNDRKEAENHPDYKGTALIDGLGECWLDAWINTSNSGTKYMSLKIKPKDQAQQQTVSHGQLPSGPPQHFDADLDDDVPF